MSVLMHLFTIYRFGTKKDSKDASFQLSLSLPLPLPPIPFLTRSFSLTLPPSLSQRNTARTFLFNYYNIYFAYTSTCLTCW